MADLTPEDLARCRVRLVDLPVWVDIDDRLWLSTTGAATRDRLVRWVAERVGLRVGSSAPALLCDEQEQHQWRLVAAPSFLRYAGGLIFDGDAEDGPAGLRILRAEDHRLLPDGSRWVDAVALAEVARLLPTTVAPR